MGGRGVLQLCLQPLKISETSRSRKDVSRAVSSAPRLIYLAPLMKEPLFMLPEDFSFMNISTEVPCQLLKGAETMGPKP